MSPKLQRLRAEIASDLRAFKTRVGEMALLPPLTDADRGSLAEAAIALHHAYGAVEAALSRVARSVDAGLPEGPDWHQALLSVMARLERLRRDAAVLLPLLEKDLARFDQFLDGVGNA